MFAGTRAPQGWALCDGRLLSRAEYGELFKLFGTTYGGEGTASFALPDLRGRAPVGQGQGVGLSPRPLGQSFGAETHGLNENEMPSHAHSIHTGGDASKSNPAGMIPGITLSSFYFYAELASPTHMASDAVSSTGGGQTHANMMPTLCINFIINLDGTIPTPN